jgi:hypothetical protein
MNDFSISQLEQYSEEFYNFSALNSFAKLEKKSGSWNIVSDGNLWGSYETKTAGRQALREIEFERFKKFSTEHPQMSYSATIRLLNKQYDEETVRKFQKLFKENFDKLYLAGNEEPEDEALEISLAAMEHFHKNANAIEMGDANFAGKRLSELVRFLLRRVPDAKRSAAIESARKKIYMINEYEMSRKKTAPNSSIGQSISIVKTILLEHNAEYIRNVLNALVRNL